jgi:hypothetical protein
MDAVLISYTSCKDAFKDAFEGPSKLAFSGKCAGGIPSSERPARAKKHDIRTPATMQHVAIWKDAVLRLSLQTDLFRLASMCTWISMSTRLTMVAK